MSLLSEYHPLRAVLVKHVRDAFIDPATIAAEWRTLHFTAPPDFGRAVEEHDRFVEILMSSGAAVHFLPRDQETTLDSIYARDASIVSPRGVILGAMGKAQRAGEPAAQARAFAQLGVAVAGQIDPPGQLEGGDLIWLDDRTLAVGVGYRTNQEGLRQLRAILEPAIEMIEVPLPHWRGPDDVMHLMSLISPIDRNLAVTYSPLMPVTFRRRLLDLGLKLVDVPHEEFETMGGNVLALGPRRCLVLAGNPRTRRALESEGCEILEYEGVEISVKGAGGPTCLTRPLARSAG